jgi:hypothetical protein
MRFRPDRGFGLDRDGTGNASGGGGCSGRRPGREILIRRTRVFVAPSGFLWRPISFEADIHAVEGVFRMVIEAAGISCSATCDETCDEICDEGCHENRDMPVMRSTAAPATRPAKSPAMRPTMDLR